MENPSERPEELEQRVADAKRRTKKIGAAFLYFGIYLLSQVVASVPVVIVLAVRAIESVGYANLDTLFAVIQASILENAVLITLISDAAALLALFLLFRARHCSFLEETRLVRPKRPLWLPILLGVFLNLFVTGALSLLPETVLADYNTASTTLLGGGDTLLTSLLLVFAAPVVEEIVFRGLIYTRLAEGLPRWYALFLASLLFGLMHGQMLWVIYTALLGLVLCRMLDHYGSLLAAIALHLAFNASSALVLLIPENTPALLLTVVSGGLAGLVYYGILKRTKQTA